MARNRTFFPGRLPFRDDSKTEVQLHDSSVAGPFSFLNPTRAKFSTGARDSESDVSTEGDNAPRTAAPKPQPSDYHFLWRSRDNRKGRHPLLVERPSQIDGKDTTVATPRQTSHPNEVLKVVLRMFTHYPVWDISWCVAYIFTWGSIVWCLNGFFSFLPFIRPSSEFSGEVPNGGGITAFIGAVLFFEVGSILLMFEAVNENNAGCFGWAVEEVISDREEKQQSYQLLPSEKHCTHHHRNRKNFVGKSASTTHADVKSEKENTKDGKTWQWFPSWSSLKDHYCHELGFLASFSQFCGATIFSISGFTALPGINNKMSQGLLDGIYWAPQVVGGSGFIISGTLYLLETQKNWYTPSFRLLGWHIAFWNLIGGIGFTLCGALGFAYANHGAQYQAACSTFWGSFAFLIGSVLQLYESLQKSPVEIARS